VISWTSAAVPLLALLAFQILPNPVLAAEPPAADATADGADAQIGDPVDAGNPSGQAGRPYQIPRSEGEVKVDGRLDEGIWKRAASISLPYETRPAENTPAPVETEALVFYDTSYIYVGFRAKDPNPEAIRAHLSDRDTAWNDDFVGIVIDTFNDERRAVEFFTNPLGVQMDLFNDDVGGSESAAWDAIWDSAGRVTEWGYEVEMAIPFHQLRFPRERGDQTWGVDLVRFYPRSDRHRIASQPMDRNISCYLCQISKMEGFNGISPGRNLEINPTLVSSRTDERSDFPAGDVETGDVDTEPGLTVRWGVTPNLSLSGTLNPDFSQVEADVAQLDVNNQFTLFFPERRPFFLEGADFFRTNFNAVFTRNVSDPAWGLKLTGKQGKNGVGVFAAQDDVTNLLFPGSEGSDSDSFDFETNDTALRYRRDFGKNSAFGGVFTSRTGDDYSNVLGGFDGLYRINDKDSIEFQVLGSRTEYPLEIAEEFEQPEESFSDTAYRLEYEHEARNWRWFFEYTDVGEDFRADMGFMPRVDYTLLAGGLRRSWFGEEADWYNRISVGGDWDLTEDQSGQLLEREVEAWGQIAGPMQSFVFLKLTNRDRFFDGVYFPDQYQVSSWSEIQPNGKLWFGMWWRVGDDVDFANTQAAETVVIEPNFRYNLGKHLRATLNHTYQKLDVEGGQLFDVNLSQLRLVYQFNVRMFVRTTFQYQTVNRDPSLYIDEVDDESEDLFTQLLFSYKLNPRTVLFFGYSDNREGFANEFETVELTKSDNTLFLKIGYAWNL
jgi:hypothetical protein